MRCENRPDAVKKQPIHHFGAHIETLQGGSPAQLRAIIAFVAMDR
jgi:hypothetical protein